jgi:hypothetical protein
MSDNENSIHPDMSTWKTLQELDEKSESDSFWLSELKAVTQLDQ